MEPNMGMKVGVDNESSASMEMKSNTPIVSTPMADKKCGKGLKIAVVGLSVVAVLGIGFGIFGVVQNSQKDGQISDLNVQVKNKNELISTLEATEDNCSSDVAVRSETKIEETPSTANNTTGNGSGLSADELANYIYVAQWGVKIALPSSLSGVSYSYYMKPGYTSLDVSGTSCAKQGQCQYAPEFANLAAGNMSLGTINRLSKGAQAITGIGQKVFSIGDYDYYYSHPQAVTSTNESEITWETESVNLIKDALTNQSNYSAI